MVDKPLAADWEGRVGSSLFASISQRFFERIVPLLLIGVAAYGLVTVVGR